MAVQVQRFVNKAKGYAFNPKNLGKIDLTGLKIKATQNFTPKAKPEITLADMEFFRRYEAIKKFDMRISPKEINELFKYEGNDFFIKAHDFLCKKMGIPENIRPEIIEALYPPEYGMLYAVCNNAIVKNINSPLKTKNEIFAALRHELQHFQQNMSIYQHEELGPKAVNVYSEILANSAKTDISERAKNFTLDQIREFGFPEDALEIYKTLQKYLADGNIEDYEKYLDALTVEVKNGYAGELENLRQTIVKEYGVIKKDSRAGNRAVKFFNEFVDEMGYKRENGELHYGKYLLRATENEAFIAQEALQRNLDGKAGCYIYDVKHQPKPEIDGNLESKVKNDLKEVTENVDAKEVLRYLYD